MTMTTSQAAIWKQITDVYEQWDQEHHAFMPVSALSERLPMVAPELIGETLAQAQQEQQAELGSIEEQPGFKPLRH